MTTLEPQTMDQITVRLDMFSFWSLQTIHSNGQRRYECTIRNDEPGRTYRKIYTGTGMTAHDACRLAIAKVVAGGKPKLRMAT